MNIRKVEIIPSLLSADFAILGREIREVEQAGCQRLHLDVMDGCFVPNISIGPVVIKAVRRHTRLYLQVHLMIDRPERYVEDFRRAGANGIIIHREACCNFLNTLKGIKKIGIDAGIALRPKTPVESIRDVIQEIDMVLVMTVEPGFGGQVFIEGTEKKVSGIRRLLEERGMDIPIGVDGGINVRTAPVVVKAGANQLIAGNAVFKGSVPKNIGALRRSIP